VSQKPASSIFWPENGSIRHYWDTPITTIETQGIIPHIILNTATVKPSDHTHYTALRREFECQVFCKMKLSQFNTENLNVGRFAKQANSYTRVMMYTVRQEDRQTEERYHAWFQITRPSRYKPGTKKCTLRSRCRRELATG
jgi:hypothetical protein